MELDRIKLQTTWNDAAASLNNNFAKIGIGISALENSTYKNKGYFKTLADLQEACPSASYGSKAYVGNSYPYAIYTWDGTSKTWITDGSTGGEENVPLGDYYTKEETHEAIKDEYVVLSQAEYDALEEKEDKLYFCYEE